MYRKIFNAVFLTAFFSAVATAVIIKATSDADFSLRDVVAVLAVIIVSAVVSAVIAGKILRPVVEADPDNPKINYSELNPLIEKIRRQKGTISRKNNEVRTSHEQLSLITENMNEGIIIADHRTNILSCNSSAVHLLGARKISIGQSIYCLNNSENFRRCIQNAMGGRNSKCILRTHNGDREIIASPSNLTDTVNGIVVFIFDVTEKQQLETMRREFTSNVSHELKTPLTTVYGISDMLANGMVKPEDVKKFGGNIRSEAERLITLINDIVSLSKLDEDSIPHENSEVDIYEVAEEVVKRLEQSAEEKNITVCLSGEHISVNGNRTVIDEIICNLCDNAIKYGKENGTAEIKISCTATKAVITVSDNGIGIPHEHINRIFERFYRVDKSHSRKIKGTGLGLSIVKHGVMYHNGTVRAESNVGKGSVFTVELPTDI